MPGAAGTRRNFFGKRLALLKSASYQLYRVILSKNSEGRGKRRDHPKSYSQEAGKVRPLLFFSAGSPPEAAFRRSGAGKGLPFAPPDAIIRKTGPHGPPSGNTAKGRPFSCGYDSRGLPALPFCPGARPKPGRSVRMAVRPALSFFREHGKRQGRPAQGRKVRPIKIPRYEITARQGGSETICCKTTSDALSATERPAFP